MCGIVAVLSRAGEVREIDLASLAGRLGGAADRVRAWGTAEAPDADAKGLEEAAAACDEVVATLNGFAGMAALLQGGAVLAQPVQRLGEAVARFEALLDQRASALGTARVERLNAVLVRLKDAAFGLQRDRLENIGKVRGLTAGSKAPGHVRAAYDLNVALNALDRLEVRGRDSAGIGVLVRGDFGALEATLADEIDERTNIANFTHQAVRRIDVDGSSAYSFVYKVAAEVGELGENVRGIRAAIGGDPLLHRLLDAPGAEAEILGHTRWASVGIISEANAHPLNQEQAVEAAGPYVVAALNGDVDNYQDLVKREELALVPEITTDAKVIPVLVSKFASDGADLDEAFRKTVSRFEGSVAIGAASAQAAGTLYLALRGSGQALYIGLARDAFLVASEPYGIVDETSRYLRLDGETPADRDRPDSRGQIVVLDASKAGTIAGLRRFAYDGTPLPVAQRR
jgi:glucosamine--fructose-6-phosphate aminotransferase (isomerizing)